MTDNHSADRYLIITSDTHVSCPAGRWSHATPLFEAFLSSLEADPPEYLFINGDIIDDMVLENGDPAMGSAEHWEKDVDTYRNAIAPYDTIDFRGSLGPNHDFCDDIPKAHASERLCSARGSFCFDGFDVVWLSGNVHSFSNEPAQREESFSDDDLQWLDKELAGKDRVVLMFHVPLTTDDTIEHGAWWGNRSIIIPTEDKIYGVIDRHLDSLKMIFNGHIHGVMESNYKGVPLKIAAFCDRGHYCRVSVHDEQLCVTVQAYPPAGQPDNGTAPDSDS